MTKTIKLGSYGQAFDAPGDRRAYTYKHQPGNQAAWRIGDASSRVEAGGDLIDRGLSLLKVLEAGGFGVFELDETAAIPAPEGESPAELVCAQAYQIVGSLLDDLGQFGTALADKILDNLSEARIVHDDVLPWPSFANVQPKAAEGDAQIAALILAEFGSVSPPHGFAPDDMVAAYKLGRSHVEPKGSATVEQWEAALSAVMPADFKDWWQNSRTEWPAVAAAVIQAQRADRDLGWEMAAKAAQAPAPAQQGKKRYWISKYALSEGVEAAEGQPSRWDTRYIDVDRYYGSFRLGTQIHETEAAAKKAAEALRKKKLASLREQIAKLEKLEF